MNEPSPPPIRVLLVDADARDQVAFQRALDQSSIPFCMTRCPQTQRIGAALASAASEPYDIVLVDVDPPGMNGLEGLMGLRDTARLPPVSVLIGMGPAEAMVSALKAGVDDYIVKDPERHYLEALPFKLDRIKQRHAAGIAGLKAKMELAHINRRMKAFVQQYAIQMASPAHTEPEVLDPQGQEWGSASSVLQEFSNQIVRFQENERRELARTLHDGICSSLVAIKYGLEAKLAGMQVDSAKVDISLEMIIDQLGNTIEEVRKLSSSLRYSVLDDMGLLKAIEWLCKNNEKMFVPVRIETALDVEEDDFSETAKIVVYRILQEALTNALKHSGAECIKISMKKEKARIVMRIMDDGCGFDGSKMFNSGDPLTGYGLKGMQDRALIVGGSLTVDSLPGQGATVSLEMPLAIN